MRTRRLPEPPTPRPRRTPLTHDLQALIWPIVKRLPSYIRLGWALAREPGIPGTQKALLLSSALYPVSPAQVVTGVIPIVGQVDGLLIFLLGLRQALASCPPEAAARYLARNRLSQGQLDRDVGAILFVAGKAANRAGVYLARNVRFLGRVAAGFGRRVARRIADDTAK